MVAVLESEIRLATSSSERLGLFMQVKIVELLVNQAETDPQGKGAHCRAFLLTPRHDEGDLLRSIDMKTGALL